MIPINVKKYKERQTELITKLEGMVQTCQTETRSFNEAEQGEYASIMQEPRSIEDKRLCQCRRARIARTA